MIAARRHLVLFVGVCLVALALPVAYMTRRAHSRTSLSYLDAPIRTVPLDRLTPDQRGILFRSTRSDETFGHVVFLPSEALDGPWYVSTLQCDRVYFQGQRGVCLKPDAALSRRTPCGIHRVRVGSLVRGRRILHTDYHR